jgi:alpha-tubulin suppressor-like RCC1 family protein
LANNREKSSLEFLEAIPRVVTGLRNKRIIGLSCNSKVVICVSSEGTLYSFGDDIKNRNGVLGLGEVYFQSLPTVIQALTGYKMVQVSVGDFHVSALDVTGSVFLWGTGNGVQRRSNVPVSLKMERGLVGNQVLSSRNGTIIATSKSMN